MSIPPVSSLSIPQRDTSLVTREEENCKRMFSDEQKNFSTDLLETIQEDLDRTRVHFLNSGLKMRDLRLSEVQLEEFLTKKGKMITQLNLSDYPTTRIITLLSLCPNLSKVFLLYPEKEKRIIRKPVLSIFKAPVATSPLNLGNQPGVIIGKICEYLEPSELAKTVSIGKSFLMPTDGEKVKLMNSGISFRNIVHNRINLAKLIHRHARKVKALNLADAFVEDFLDPIVECQSLTSLSLKNCKISHPFLRDLLQRISAVSLLILDLGASRPKHCGRSFHYCNYIGVEGVKVLANSQFTNLTYLDLSYNDLADAGIAELSVSKNFLYLKTLILTANRIRYQGIKVLCSSTTLPSLTAVDLAQNPIENEGFNCLFSSPFSSKIETINFRGADLEFYQGLTVESISLVNLTSLNLSNNVIGDSFIESLINSTVHITIIELNLHHTHLGQEEMETLSEPGVFPNLKSLILSSNDLGDLGVIIFSSSTIFNSLRSFDLSYNKVTDNGAFALVASLNEISELTTLNLSGNSITAIGVAAIMFGTETKNNLSISIYNNQIEIGFPKEGRGVILKTQKNFNVW